MKKVIKALLNENSNQNVFLEFGDVAIEFEQMALILVRNNSYAILRPVTIMDGIDNEEGLVFLVDEINNKVILMEDEDVEYAVYNIDHPLTGKPIMTIKTNGADPKEALKKAAEQLKADSEAFKQLIEENL